MPGEVIELPFEWPERPGQVHADPEVPPPIAKLLARRPWLVAGAATVLGFAFSRFLKASGRTRYEQALGSSQRRELPSTPPSSPQSTAHAAEARAIAGPVPSAR